MTIVIDDTDARDVHFFRPPVRVIKLTMVQMEVTAADGAASDLENDISVLDNFGLVCLDYRHGALIGWSYSDMGFPSYLIERRSCPSRPKPSFSRRKGQHTSFDLCPGWSYPAQ